MGTKTNDPTSVEYSSLDETLPLVFNMGVFYFSRIVLATFELILIEALGEVILNPFFAASALACAYAPAMEVAGAQNAY
jgi:hypothetical protein